MAGPYEPVPATPARVGEQKAAQPVKAGPYLAAKSGENETGGEAQSFPSRPELSGVSAASGGLRFQINFEVVVAEHVICFPR